jgi:hypothetical protein
MNSLNSAAKWSAASRLVAVFNATCGSGASAERGGTPSTMLFGASGGFSGSGIKMSAGEIGSLIGGTGGLARVIGALGFFFADFGFASFPFEEFSGGEFGSFVATEFVVGSGLSSSGSGFGVTMAVSVSIATPLSCNENKCIMR